MLPGHALEEEMHTDAGHSARGVGTYLDAVSRYLRMGKKSDLPQLFEDHTSTLEEGRGRSSELEYVLDSLRRMNEIREEEARRIARTLHDESSQLLAAVHIAIDDITKDLPPEQVGRLRRVSSQLHDVEKHLRHLSHELVPTLLADYGLHDALEFLREGMTRRYGIPISLECSLEERPAHIVETTAYRLIQEALQNACIHAYATRIQVKVRLRNDRLMLLVRDDGVGFNPKRELRRLNDPGIGLVGMNERATALGGRVRFFSRPDRGTAVVAKLPAGTRREIPGKPVRGALPKARRSHVDPHTACG